MPNNIKPLVTRRGVLYHPTLGEKLHHKLDQARDYFDDHIKNPLSIYLAFLGTFWIVHYPIYWLICVGLNVNTDYYRHELELTRILVSLPFWVAYNIPFWISSFFHLSASGVDIWNGLLWPIKAVIIVFVILDMLTVPILVIVFIGKIVKKIVDGILNLK